MINRLLVANRGEITRRIFRTCRELGVSTVAVYSDADADAPHAGEADVAVRLPGTSSADTYLRADLLVKAALDTGADAVHPGYGFLSENAEFARTVLDAGLIWVGPAPDAIEAMGSKVRSKHMMAQAGVPVLSELTVDDVTESDLPVLVKASAGGGGRGMRVVRSVAELPDAVASAAAEAGSAFGDATVFCERYLESGRHIEVQVLADQAGTVWALGERECSIQRRHQKVLEEAPSPLVTDEMRTRLCEAAVSAARAVSYVGAGTVEFLATDDGSFHFLEMNTRLQVEHPVTECVTGLDLVALQLSVAEGTPLPASGPPEFDGHAIEARLYAEDPARDWQPQSGLIRRFELPERDSHSSLLRVDSGVETGSTVTVFYDPMLAKVIAWAPDRTRAARTLAGALAAAQVHGVRTNRDLLVRVLRHPAFLSGDINTAFFDQHGLADLAAPLATPETVRLSALAAALADSSVNRAAATIQPGLPSGWRNVPSGFQLKRYAPFEAPDDPEQAVEVTYRLGRDGLIAPGYPDVRLLGCTSDKVELEVEGLRRTFTVHAYAKTGDAPSLVTVESALGPVALTPLPRFTDPSDAIEAGSLLAPMPGTVLRVAVALGDQVSAGDPVLWLEAMKMEHRISAPADGVISELPVEVGQQVSVGTVLAVVGEPES
jgi:propionyl-CoA carboxylase alpha chain